METMLAAVFKGNGVLQLEQVPVPRLQKPDQVLLKVRAASICGSDLQALKVPPGHRLPAGIVLGHEFFGTIVQIGEAVRNYQPGDEVVVNPCIPCGECWECKRGMVCRSPEHYGQTCDGGFAQYVAVEAGQLHRVPAGVSPDAAAQTEPLACILDAIGKIRVSPTDHVLLYGAGPIGLTFVQVLRIFGVKHLAVVARGRARMEQARRCGASLVIDQQKETVAEAIERAWGEPADIVVDAVGAGTVLSEAIDLLHSRGQILLFGYNENAVAQVRPSVLTAKELRIVGALGKDFPSAIALLQDERLHLADLVSHRFALADINRAISMLLDKTASRAIIYPNGDMPE